MKVPLMQTNGAAQQHCGSLNMTDVLINEKHRNAC